MELPASEIQHYQQHMERDAKVISKLRDDLRKAEIKIERLLGVIQSQKGQLKAWKQSVY